MRRAAPASDSLDLLLDTISNVFGGVVLMAILIALQVQFTAERTSAPATKPDPELQLAELELERAQRELTRLRAREDASGAAGLTQVAERKQSFLSTIQEVQDQLRAERELRDAELELSAESSAELDRLTARHAKLEGEVGEAESALGAIRRSPRHEVRLPYQHQSAAPGQLSIMVSGGEVYLLSEDCVSTSVGETPGARLWSPVPGRGREPTEATIRSYLRGIITPSMAMVSFWVSETDASFQAFQRAKAVVLGLGFDYSVSPFSESTGLITFPGRPEAE